MDTKSNKPFSEACERNKVPILEQLRHWLKPGNKVLEIGSGTGQHGMFFARQLPQITWQCTDQPIALPGLQQWIDDAHLINLPDPWALDVNEYAWDTSQYHAIFSANTLHIMAWPTVKQFLTQVNQALLPNGKLILYGPFRYQGNYTSESNATFDQYLRTHSKHCGIRDLEAIQILLNTQGFSLTQDCPMPANNQLLLWTLN